MPVNYIESWAQVRRIIAAACIVGLSLGIGLISSCANNSSIQAESQIEPREIPIPLQATKENKGQRCEARYYFGVHNDKNMEPNEGYSPHCYELQLRMNQAVRDGNPSEIREVLRYGANPTLPVDDLHPPLLQAAHNGRADIVRLLLDNGADVNEGTVIIGTPLIAAAIEGHANVVRLLLERGADICFKADGGTAKEFARKNGHKEVLALLQTAESELCGNSPEASTAHP